MKFQVQGELDIPIEITELLTGMRINSNAEEYTDIRMSLSQSALDRLSVILSMLYATQPLADVEARMVRVMAQKVQQVSSTVISTEAITSPTSNPAVQTMHKAVELPVQQSATKQVTTDITKIGILEQKPSKDAPTKSIASLSKNMRNRVG